MRVVTASRFRRDERRIITPHKRFGPLACNSPIIPTNRTAPAAPPRPSAKSSPCSGLGRNARARVGDHRAQLLAGLEDGNGPCRYFDGITSPWIPRHPRFALTDLERPKPAYLNVMLLG